MSTKHTAEPWIVTESTESFIIAPPETDATVIACVGTTVRSGTVNRARTSEANAARIVACVNALQGIPDPAAALQQAREALGLAMRVCEDQYHYEQFKSARAALGGQP